MHSNKIRLIFALSINHINICTMTYENLISILNATSDLSKIGAGVYEHNITGQQFDLLHERATGADREVLIALIEFIEENSRKVGHAEAVAICQKAISNLFFSLKS